jgi:cell pole-organizing protein PopZ
MNCRTTGASVAQAFDTLATSMMLQNTDMIEQLTREMLRPMLKTWLDDNLPTIVERLVRAEIERVARGRRA